MTFKREERYAVFKLSDMDETQLDTLDEMRRQLPDTIDCVVVESHQPEFEMVWKSIEERCA